MKRNKWTKLIVFLVIAAIYVGFVFPVQVGLWVLKHKAEAEAHKKELQRRVHVQAPVNDVPVRANRPPMAGSGA